jgi:uncharacterized membrane protein
MPLDERDYVTSRKKVSSRTPRSSRPEHRILGGIAYAGVVAGFIVPLFIFSLKRHESSFVEFHALQAFLLGVIGTVSYFVFGLLPVPGVLPLFFLGYVGVAAVSAYAAFTGRTWSIPLVGKWTEQILDS